jgi:hypothetical protein
MNTDLIIKEWFYRLPNGYANPPYTATEWAVLTEVLDEFGIDIKSTTLTEPTIAKHVSFADMLLVNNKEDKFNFFIENLPLSVVNEYWNIIHETTHDEKVEFIERLASETTIRPYASAEYSTGLGKKLFNITGDNTVGRGEVFISWLVDGAYPQGPSKSYDIQIKDMKYEVKDYSKPGQQNKSIRLGTKGKVTQFKFWNEIINTIQRLDQLNETLLELNSHISLSETLINELNYFKDRGSEILTGKLSLTDQEHITTLYTELHALPLATDDYTHVIVRGPYKEPIKLHIESIDLDNKYIKISPIENNTQLLTYVITELRRIRYVREPNLFYSDLQETVKQIIGTEIPFVVFRRDGAVITTDFMFDTVDQGTVRIIEHLSTRRRQPMEEEEEDEP